MDVMRPVSAGRWTLSRLLREESLSRSGMSLGLRIEAGTLMTQSPWTLVT